MSYSDSDDEIERLVGIPGGIYAAEQGVSALHQLEAAVLLGALAGEEPHVISAAASVVERELVRQLLPGNAYVVRLSISVADALIRQAAGEHRRAMSATELTELADRREPFFAAVEDINLDATQTTQELVEGIINAVGGFRKGLRSAGDRPDEAGLSTEVGPG